MTDAQQAAINAATATLVNDMRTLVTSTMTAHAATLLDACNAAGGAPMNGAMTFIGDQEFYRECFRYCQRLIDQGIVPTATPLPW